MLILIIYVCKQTLSVYTVHKLGLQRVIKIDSKTDKWKSDRALERIKN